MFTNYRSFVCHIHQLILYWVTLGVFGFGQKVLERATPCFCAQNRGVIGVCPVPCFMSALFVPESGTHSRYRPFTTHLPYERPFSVSVHLFVYRFFCGIEAEHFHCYCDKRSNFTLCLMFMKQSLTQKSYMNNCFFFLLLFAF